MSDHHPIKIAIVGGGCAAMAAAFELSRPVHAGKFQITVYQVGFRLGGKGASGRGGADRIEEHGLHLWMGFYENAFRLMRECYAEAARDPRTCRIADWRDAFFPDNFNAVADRSPGGAWLPWKVNFTPLPGLPGDPVERTRPWTVADYMVRTAVLVRTLFETIEVRTGQAPSPHPTRVEPYPTEPSAIVDAISRLLRIGQLASVGALIEALRLMELAVAGFGRYPENVVLRLLDLVSQDSKRRLEQLVSNDDGLRRLWEIVDLTLSTMRGVISHRLLTDPRGFDAIDDYDCREWLKMHGASDRAINSAYIRALYDLAFAYDDGDITKPRIAAGQAVRGTLRAFFTYRGAFFWKMAAGMGDVVFAPFYEVLKKRGVRFEFFHRLRRVRIDQVQGDAQPHVAALEFDVQAKTLDGTAYQPLVDVRGLPCWPAEPDYAQLIDGERLREADCDFESDWDASCVEQRTLQVTRDFDLVVLAVGVGTIAQVCQDIVASNEQWRQMIASTKTVATQALQLWLRESTAALGWGDGPVNISGFVEPFDTWADMTHLVREESHAEQVKAIAYFCSVLPDAPGASFTDHKTRLNDVRNNAITFLNRDVRHLWPQAVNQSGKFRWELLVAAESEPGFATPEAHIDGQYLRANINASDRYTLSLPGSLRQRISPLDHSYDNLTVAGDWTRCGFNAGCVEAAVMSGRLAAHAISSLPPLEEIVGFDHP